MKVADGSVLHKFISIVYILLFFVLNVEKAISLHGELIINDQVMTQPSSFYLVYSLQSFPTSLLN